VEEARPGAARSWYLTGSAADATSVATSDVDLVIVLRDGMEAQEADAVREAAQRAARAEGIELDLGLLDARSLQRGVDPQLKLGSRWIGGEDVVATAPLLPIEQWARERMHAAYYLMVSVFGREPWVREPLDYPRPGNPFFGYAERDVLLSHGRRAPSTRNLVRVSGWMATALLAWQRATYVVRKSDCPRLYRREIGDKWSDFLERVHTSCRERWSYLIPADEAGRAELRAMCEMMLLFERHFLRLYREFVLGEFVLGELRAGGERAERARWVMEQIPFEDPEVQMALAGAQEADGVHGAAD
jgi:predicted nucleotidyltransferase